MKFIDPKIDFAFKKIFGSESAKDVLISFLESLFGLEGQRRIAEITLLDPFLAPKIREMKYSILDVKCRDHRGITYIVEMQVQKVSAFLKRIQFNVANSYTNQIKRGDDYPKLNQVIAVTITDFVLFGDFAHYLSRHETRETITGHSFLQDIVYIFVELPKFTKSLEQLEGILEQWIYFIRYADSLREIPPQLQADPFHHAFEMAMVANMTDDELELYQKAGIAIADARGMLELAREEGREKGRREKAVSMLLKLMGRKFGPIPDWATGKITSASAELIETWSENILFSNSVEEVFAAF